LLKTFGWIASLLLVDYPPSLPLLLNITGGHHQNHSCDEAPKNNLPRELQQHPSERMTITPHMMDSNPQTSSEQLEKVRTVVIVKSFSSYNHSMLRLLLLSRIGLHHWKWQLGIRHCQHCRKKLSTSSFL
jgi:hypothetical protein